MRRVAVKIAYLGKNFFGSQRQPGKRTVEGDIISDMEKIGQTDIDLKMAGRTDRGVNASGNVASFNTDFEDLDKLLRALNGVSDDIFYTAYAHINDDFNPRHAKERVYRYTLDIRGLDVSLLNECAFLFIGKHDFSRFCRNDERSTVVNMSSISVTVDGDRCFVNLRADHFLWNMVRRIIAAMVAVACGRMTLDDVKDALDGKDVFFGLAPSEGLVLRNVIYDNVQFVKCDSYLERLEERSFTVELEKELYDSLK